MPNCSTRPLRPHPTLETMRASVVTCVLRARAHGPAPKIRMGQLLVRLCAYVREEPRAHARAYQLGFSGCTRKVWLSTTDMARVWLRLRVVVRITFPSGSTVDCSRMYACVLGTIFEGPRNRVGARAECERGIGRGQGRGIGRRQGRGIGRGQGRGIGRGQGRGIGRGQGRGIGRRQERGIGRG